MRHWLYRGAVVFAAAVGLFGSMPLGLKLNESNRWQSMIRRAYEGSTLPGHRPSDPEALQFWAETDRDFLSTLPGFAFSMVTQGLFALLAHTLVPSSWREASKENASRPISRSKQLGWAAMTNKREEVQRRLSADADPDRLCNGVPPLGLAAEKGHRGVVELLLEAGSDPNLASDHHDTFATGVALIRSRSGL